MEEKILNQICELIGKNLGYSIIDEYREFYKDKEDNIIFLSVETLLTELVGPKAAKNELVDVRNYLKQENS